jgi:hypothetical protein
VQQRKILLKRKAVCYTEHKAEDSETDGDINTSAMRKKNGQHKTVTYFPHWRQLFGLVKNKRENREISEAWDNAWMAFAVEELESKKEKKNAQKEKSRMCCLSLRMCWELAMILPSAHTRRMN